MKPYVRIFPHGPEEFPSVDHLMGWLLNGLRGRAGRYHFRSKRVDELPMGSVVLFRYWDSIVGEAIVSKEPVWEQERERTWSGEEVEYVGHVTFAPSSIRLYSPPLPALCLQQLMEDSGVGKDILKSAQLHVKLDNWDIYPRIMQAVVSQGGFIQ
jgi:hypothetical protein